MFRTHLSLSLSKGWFVFSFSSWGFSFSFFGVIKNIWGLVGWFLFLSFSFQNIEKNLKEKAKLFDFFIYIYIFTILPKKKRQN